MRKKVLVLLSICVVFIFIGGVTSFAQMPAPPLPEHESEGKYHSEKTATVDNGEPDTIIPSKYSDFNPGSVNVAGSPGGVTFGKPGLSFKYDRTFGTTGEAYFDDPAHLNDPRGLGTDGENVWIVECAGRRALKYANNDTSTVLMQIGKAGYRLSDDTQMNCLMDVAVDGSGNIWLVDMNFQHVIEYDSSGNYIAELGEDWEYGSGNDQFANPYGVAIDSDDNVYISDRDNHRVQVFDKDRNYLATIGSGPGSGDEQFNSTRHLTIDENDKLYVADYENQRVQIFDVSEPITPIHLGSIDMTSFGGYPQGVAVDLSHNRIFVADWESREVQVFDATTWEYIDTPISLNVRPYDVVVDSSGNLFVTQHNPFFSQVYRYDSSLIFQQSYGTEGFPYLTDDNHYNRPSGVAVGNDDSIYIIEGKGQRLIKLNSDGVFQWMKGEPGILSDDNDHFSNPQDVDSDINGWVYAADSGNCRIQIYDADGNYINTLNGYCGNGAGEFGYAEGVAIAPSGNIYVADSDNACVQVYDNNLVFQASLTQTGSVGGNLPFTYIVDIDVDNSGNIYLVDSDQHVVHIFNSSLEYQRSLGEYGVESNDFGYFSYPEAVTVDDEGRIYVADKNGNRIQVFDNNGAFLTTLAGARGGGTGQLFASRGLAVDSQGSLYIADQENHRIQKYTRGVPGWKQVNINGFGNHDTVAVTALEDFGNYLYAGMRYEGEDTSTPVWRMNNKGTWEQVISEGLVMGYDDRVNDFIKYRNRLYAGIGSWTWGVENSVNKGIWRSANGTNWTRVVNGGFTDPQNQDITNFFVFRNILYATTWSANPDHGAEIWSTRNGDTGTWAINVANGFGNVHNIVIPATVEYKGCLYAGTYKGNYGIEGAEIWRTCDGFNWKQVMQNGFGNPNNGVISALGVFKNRLYAGTRNKDNPDAGAELWMCVICNGRDWQMAPVGKGFGDANNIGIYDLLVVNNIFFAIMNNHETGLEIWQTIDSRNWWQVNPDGFGDSINSFTNWGSHPSAIFRNQIYFGTQNNAQGGEIWKYCCPNKRSPWPWGHPCTIGKPLSKCNPTVNECFCDFSFP